MTALILDAGAFVAVERDDRAVVSRLRVARLDGIEFRTSAIVISEVWRDPLGRQARLARFLRSVDVADVDEQLARDAGVLLGRAGTSNPIDALVVLTAEHGDQILTSDPDDIRHLAAVANRAVDVIPC